MALDPEALRARLEALLGGRPVQRWLVAFSGGIDSTVLLHALHRALPSAPIVAVHIDHGLQEASAAWERHCREVAGALGVDYQSRRVAVPRDADGGPEAAAREARYEALLSLVGPGDCVLSGHHEDDQAETLLLNLLRGSGAAGLAGIGASQSFGSAWLLRPMLGVSAEDIREYAERHALEWIDDPSNVDTRFDRNFLRNEVLPVLSSRWPAAARSLSRSAELIGEASELLDQLADIDIQSCGRPSELCIDVLGRLDAARQRNLLKRAIRLCGLPPPPASRLYQAVDELVPARADAQPRVTWPGGELRRYRRFVYVLPRLQSAAGLVSRSISLDAEPVSVGTGLGRIRLRRDAGRGISPGLASEGLEMRFREGGEEIRPHEGGPMRKLKKLLQEEGILPWMRDRLPLVYAGERLVAVADLWLAADAASSPGVVVEWLDKPTLRSADD